MTISTFRCPYSTLSSLSDFGVFDRETIRVSTGQVFAVQKPRHEKLAGHCVWRDRKSVRERRNIMDSC